MKITRLALTAALALTATGAFAAEKYSLDPAHTQVLFGWNHMGFSNIHGWFTTVEGDVMLDTADPTKSSVSVTIPIDSVGTGVVKLDDHLKSDDFFDAKKFPTATFKSTKVEKTGDAALKVTGDLTIHGVTKTAVLDVKINKIGEHPMAKVPAAGFDASTTVKRSDFGMAKYVPNVSDEIKIQITTETQKAK